MSVTIRLLQGDLRAKISADGTVTSYAGQTIGFINGDGSAGDMCVSQLKFEFSNPLQGVKIC